MLLGCAKIFNILHNFDMQFLFYLFYFSIYFSDDEVESKMIIDDSNKGKDKKGKPRYILIQAIFMKNAHSYSNILNYVHINLILLKLLPLCFHHCRL